MYGCISTSGLVGFFIQLGTFSKENHSFIYLGKDADGVDIIIEATPRKGVVISRLDKYDLTSIVWNRHEAVTPSQLALIIKVALTHLNDPYFFRSFIVIGLRILGLTRLTWIAGNLEKAKGVICSELVAICYRAAGIEIEKDKPVYFVTPSDLSFRLLFI